MRLARRTSWLKRVALAPFARTHAPGAHIVLTFDDGPHPEHTPAVLDRLAAFGLRAAFFLVGNRVTDPALVQRILADGHALGNHTFTHAVPRWHDGLTAFNDVKRCQARVPGATLFRPPLGKLTPGLWFAAKRHNLRCWNWSLDSGDWRCRNEADAATCAREVLTLTHPGDVILFHDDHRWIGPILDAVLPELAERSRHAGTVPFHRTAS